MQSAILYSHSQGDPAGGVPRLTFALDAKSSSLPSIVDMDFVVDGVRYHYGFEATDKAFTSEWLYAFPRGRQQILFEREGERKVRFGRELKGRNKVIADLMRPNSLFLSVATQNDHKLLSKVSSFFASLTFNSSVSVESAMVSFLFIDDDVDNRTINFLEKIGSGVTGCRKKETDIPEEQKKFMQEIYAASDKFTGEERAKSIPLREKNIDIELSHNSADGKKRYLAIERESAGTRRLLVLLNSAFRALDKGELLIIDELDASLHTQACEAILALFSNKDTNPKGAQLVATTHDTNLMKSEHLRRDQIWFTEKDKGGATHLYPLSDIQTRKNDNIEKGYLQGRYGAIPFSGSANDLLAKV